MSSSVKLADAVLSLPIVVAALAVREGGRLAVARGIQLAEMVLRAGAIAGGDEAESGGHR